MLASEISDYVLENIIIGLELTALYGDCQRLQNVCTQPYSDFFTAERSNLEGDDWRRGFQPRARDLL